MAIYLGGQPLNLNSTELFIPNLNGAQNVRFEEQTSATGNPLLGDYTRTFSELVFESGGLTYTYRGNWVQSENRGLLTGSVSASGSYDGITVSNGSGTIATYDGTSFAVEFGTASSVPLLDLVGNLLSVLLGSDQGGSGAFENLNTDATPNLAALAFAGNDTLTGNGGSDTLVGFAGSDTMRGLGGNDIYFIDNAGDVVDESVAGSTGVDTVRSSAISINLLDASRFKGAIEQAALDGSLALNANGNGLANYLQGNSAANRLDGGAGVDLLRGLGGNDTYVIDNGGDTVDESAAGSAGVDTVRSSVISVQLFDTAHFKGSIEQAAVDGSLALNAVGNSINNYLQGNNAANGINGGLGNDILRGNGGADRFHFNTALNAATNVDVIKDFAFDDAIHLARTIFSGIAATGTLAAAAFASNATGTAGDASDRIIYENDTGRLFYDADGIGSAGGTHFATISVGFALTNADFVVI